MAGDKYTGKNVGAMGRGAKVEKVVFDQRSSELDTDVDLVQLAQELSSLRVEARKRATEPEHDEAVASLGRAEKAAQAGDRPAVADQLKQAGAWAGRVATAIGTSVAAKLIEELIKG